MVRKDELCEWFKNLQPNKRIDYMCGLLHLCLPLELRFIGTVLEDLAKKDFHSLRDSHGKANNPSDLNSSRLSSLSESFFRSKLLISLSLMNSTNSQCADIIFSILRHLKDWLENDYYGTVLHSKEAAEEIVMVLTLAVHHPAFKTHQKLELAAILKIIDERAQELYPGENEAQIRNPLKLTRSQSSGKFGFPSNPNSSNSGKGAIRSIDIKGSREDHQNSRGGPSFQIHTTWSNGEITEVYMKFKQLQEIHQKLMHTFPEDKKKKNLHFPGRQSFFDDTLQGQVNSLHGYFREFMNHSHLVNCDIVSEPLRNGAPVFPPRPYPQAPHQPYEGRDHQFYYQFYTMPPYQNGPYIDGPHVSSSNESPSNSRTSSPVVMPIQASVRPHHMNPDKSRTNIMADRGQGNLMDTSVVQLLKVLDLERYSDNLMGYTCAQLSLMNKEDFEKAGLPPDAQEKLYSKLRSSQDNGPVDPKSGVAIFSDQSSSLACPVLQLPQNQFIMTSPLTPYSEYFLQCNSANGAMLVSPVTQQIVTGGESSPANSEVSTSPPPSSPSHHTVRLASSTDAQGVGVLGSYPAVTGNMSAQVSVVPSSAAVPVSSPSPVEQKLTKGAKLRHVDSPGSEDDKGAESREARRGRGPVRPHSTILNTDNLSSLANPVIEDGKLVALTNPSQPLPLAGMELRSDQTPPPPNAPVSALPPSSSSPALVNGYRNDPPPLPQGTTTMMHRPMGMTPRPYKTAQPTHTAPGLHKNIINVPMPGFDQMTLVKSNGQVMHTNLHHPSLMNPSVISTTTPGGAGPPSSGNKPPHMVSPAAQHPPNFGGPYHMMVRHPPNALIHPSQVIVPGMTATPSHPPGLPPPSSHSPSPIATAVSLDPEQTSGFIVPQDLNPSSELRADVSNRATPPTNSTPHPSGKPLVNAVNNVNADTPSPPLTPATIKANQSIPPPPGHHPANCTCEAPSLASTTGPSYYYQAPVQCYVSGVNGLMPVPHFFHPQPQQASSQQPFLNGMNPEHYLRYTSQVPPYLYGNSVFPNQQHPPPPGNVSLPQASAQSSGNTAGKNMCYNCGHTGHKAADCKESTMENMSSTFHLNYNDSE